MRSLFMYISVNTMFTLAWWERELRCKRHCWIPKLFLLN